MQRMPTVPDWLCTPIFRLTLWDLVNLKNENENESYVGYTEFSLCSVARKCSRPPKPQNLGAQRGWILRAPASLAVPQQQRSHGGHVDLSLAPPGCCLWCSHRLGWENKICVRVMSQGWLKPWQECKKATFEVRLKALVCVDVGTGRKRESVANKTGAHMISCQSHHVSKPVFVNWNIVLYI